MGVVITTSLDDFSCDNPSSPLNIDGQPASIRFMEEGISILRYSSPLCPRCISRNVSRNGMYIRLVHGYTVRIQKYICRDCSYSFEARPPGYGKHIPDDLREKSTGSRALSSLRKTAKMCMVFTAINVSHETVRVSVPPIQESERMESSGYFSHDGQYVSIDGVRKY